jgi:hypothetical protein
MNPPPSGGLSVSVDVPCTSETETVEVIDTFQKYLATDKHVYFAPKEANILHNVGDILPAGTILTDAISVIHHKSLPRGIPLFLERRFLGHDYLSGLCFPNEEVRVSHNADMTKATFTIIGRQEDVDRFWRTFHERVLDPNLPKMTALGGWINPAAFIYENVLYPRVRLFYVDMAKTGPQRLPMVNTRVLRSLIPPGVLFSLHMSMPPVMEPEIGVFVLGKTDKPRVGMRHVTGEVHVSSGETSIRAC